MTRNTATLDDEYTPDAEYDSECNLEDKGNSRADAQVCSLKVFLVIFVQS